MFEVPEDEVSEKPTRRVGPNEVGNAAFEPSSGEIPEQAEESPDAVDTKVSIDSLAESVSVSETVDTGRFPEPPTATPLVDEKPMEQAEQSVASDEETLSTEAPIVEATEAAQEPLPTEVSPVETTSPVNTRDFIFGAEVILLLSALATGLAWVYMHRRGG